jgi:hypothetical protein
VISAAPAARQRAIDEVEIVTSSSWTCPDRPVVARSGGMGLASTRSRANGP